MSLLYLVICLTISGVNLQGICIEVVAQICTSKYILAFVNKLSSIHRIQVLVWEIRRSMRIRRAGIQIDITKYSLYVPLTIYQQSKYVVREQICCPGLRWIFPPKLRKVKSLGGVSGQKDIQTLRNMIYRLSGRKMDVYTIYQDKPTHVDILSWIFQTNI